MSLYKSLGYHNIVVMTIIFIISNFAVSIQNYVNNCKRLNNNDETDNNKHINGTKEQKPGTGSKRAHWHWGKRRKCNLQTESHHDECDFGVLMGNEHLLIL